jgi:hypothetical protein
MSIFQAISEWFEQPVGSPIGSAYPPATGTSTIEIDGVTHTLDPKRTYDDQICELLQARDHALWETERQARYEQRYQADLEYQAWKANAHPELV